MSLKDMATKVAALDTLSARITEELDKARTELQGALEVARREQGTDQIRFDLQGVDLGKATLVSPADSAVVTDVDALLRWVREVAPSEIQTKLVTAVRPAWLAQLLKEIGRRGEATWAHPETGELHDVPGVALRSRASYARLTVPEAGKAALEEAWRTGSVWRVALPELTAGEEEQ